MTEQEWDTIEKRIETVVRDANHRANYLENEINSLKNDVFDLEREVSGLKSTVSNLERGR